MIELPKDVIDIILSYGDPIINEKYSFVMKQIEYLKREFNYKRLQPYNIWYHYTESDFMEYILYKNNSKSVMNYRHVKCDHAFCIIPVGTETGMITVVLQPLGGTPVRYRVSPGASWEDFEAGARSRVSAAGVTIGPTDTLDFFVEIIPEYYE